MNEEALTLSSELGRGQQLRPVSGQLMVPSTRALGSSCTTLSRTMVLSRPTLRKGGNTSAHVLVGALTLGAGLVLVIVCRPFSERLIAFQRMMLRVRWGTREVRLTEAVAIVVGILASIFGLIVLSGLVPLAP